MRYVVCLLMLVAVGCAGPALDGTVPVSGTVTYQGEPVEGAMVMFIPEGDWRAASGRADADGRFHLSTLAPSDGAMVGSYKVTISKTEVSASRESDEAPPPSRNPEWPPITATELVPVKYKRPETSGLEVEVTSNGENDFSFELED